MTLLSNYDVVRHTNLLKSKPIVVQLIPVIEQQNMLKMFGREFYDILKSDIVEYEENAQYKGNYVESTQYEEAGIVKYKGDYYEYKVNVQGEKKTPDCGMNWVEKDKFKTPCYNTLWNEHLVKFLSWKVYHMAIPSLHIQHGVNGYQYQDNDGAGGKGSNKEWLNTYTSSILSIISVVESGLIEYLFSSNKDCDFSKVKLLNNCGESKTTTQKGGRKFYSRR